MENKISRTEKIGLVSTIILWGIIVLIIVFVPLKSKTKKFETIQITLASTPMTKPAPTTKPAQPVAKPAPTTKPAQPAAKSAPTTKPAQPAAKSAPTTKPEQPAAKSAPTTKPAQPALKQREEKIVQSVDDLMKQTAKVPRKKAVWDDSLFQDSEPVTSSSDNSTKPTQSVTNKPVVDALQGSAAKTSDTSQKSVAAVETAETAATKATAKEGTEKLVAQNAGKVSPESSEKPSGISNSQTTTSGSTSSGVAGSIQWQSGKSRTIVEPAVPEIKISEKNQHLITASKNVTLRFVVKSNGTVTLSSIEILPSGILPAEIQAELRTQISRWRFETAPTEGIAQFPYRITVE